MKRDLMDLWMKFLWITLSPLLLFVKKRNCWYYCLFMRYKHGGEIHRIASKNWSGYHYYWEAPCGTNYEYTVTYRMGKHEPWWTLVLYTGKIRKFRTIKIG